MELSALSIRVARTPGLGMLPQITSQILRMVDNPNASPRQIGALIERDPGLASKLLKTANSAYYGSPGKIKTVSQAISVMGLSAVRSVVVSQAYQQMTAVRGASKRFDRLAFWQHSLATASAARVLAKLKGYRDPEEAFLAGLMHDAGRLVMDRFLPNEFDQICTLALERVIPLIEAEREVLGYTHVEIGDMLAEQWNLPDGLRTAIRMHHQPKGTFAECPLGYLVYAANIVAHQVGFALQPPVLYSLEEQPKQELGIPDAQLEGLKQVVLQEVMRTQEVLKI
ncbi:MAG: HDOD domain-containing protein [Fimbriimonadales bacterium]|jgi:HD-like signal output (HDOD) protein|nr:HDOD domain-containing protein [Armatimonadota bacterium]MCX7687516.1 HDOD domain-containing protein [Fimbriimonadales bacterium]CUU10369.1 HD-like signal output (HDOD) domain, no enzymatic activity [Armatimonadetes bacterium GBS]CUU33976.1 HD-like signal output (HDOD) domain, no enzymatic activity [Armatimonadetes bacterium DC]CUU34592.1 HD-like signal output (HDOD) domain, no enzymatic activity [Armatimonadetes bacterium GXS]